MDGGRRCRLDAFARALSPRSPGGKAKWRRARWRVVTLAIPDDLALLVVLSASGLTLSLWLLTKQLAANLLGTPTPL